MCHLIIVFCGHVVVFFSTLNDNECTDLITQMRVIGSNLDLAYGVLPSLRDYDPPALSEDIDYSGVVRRCQYFEHNQHSW